MTTLTHGMIDQLRALQKIIGQGNAERGFHEEGVELLTLVRPSTRYKGGSETFSDKALRNYYTARLALITTEVAEAIEELRAGRAVDETWYSVKGEDVRTWEAENGSAGAIFDSDSVVPEGIPKKPEGVPSEVADIVIRAFDFAHEAGIDLAAMIDEKLAHNATRGHKHGKEF